MIEQAVLTINEPDSILKTPPRKGNHGGFIWLFFRPFEVESSSSSPK